MDHADGLLRCMNVEMLYESYLNTPSEYAYCLDPKLIWSIGGLKGDMYIGIHSGTVCQSMKVPEGKLVDFNPRRKILIKRSLHCRDGTADEAEVIEAHARTLKEMSEWHTKPSEVARVQCSLVSPESTTCELQLMLSLGCGDMWHGI
eukprot:2250218-Amphidinium_carterae.1